MFEFIVVGDIHSADNAPGCRIDNYRETVFNKISFIRDYANKRKVASSIFLGDIFHRKAPSLNSHFMVRELISIFKGFEKQPIVIPGNHDISMSAENLNRQPISVLEKASAVCLLGHPVTAVSSLFVNEQAAISGLCYADSNDKSIDNYLTLETKSPFNILAIHQMLLPDGDTFFGDFINFADLAESEFDIILCGHYHPGFNPPVIFKHDKFFCNPGALTRGTLDAHNLERTPGFVVFSISDSLEVSWEFVQVPHETADKVFDLKKAEASKVRKEDMEVFSSSLKEALEQEIDISSVDGLLSIFKSMGAGKELLDLSRDYLSRAKEELKS